VSYGSMADRAVAPVSLSSRRLVPVLAAAALAVAAVALVAVSVLDSSNGQFVELGETSIRTDEVHPYNTMHVADQKFINPNQLRDPAVNAAPEHPYHAGVRPRMVHHAEFEHEPYGNKWPWQNGPEGALVKYEKRADKLEGYHYMVNEDGVVRKWKENLPLSEVKKGAITSDTLKKLSPMKEPDDTTEEIAQQLLKNQRDDIQSSFRSIMPNGAFHDDIIDGKTGSQLFIPDAGQETAEVTCPPGLVECHDESCAAHPSYCPGCDAIPAPDFCTAYAEKPSGWSPSAIGCDIKDLAACGMHHGDNLYSPGESVSGGFFTGGLA